MTKIEKVREVLIGKNAPNLAENAKMKKGKIILRKGYFWRPKVTPEESFANIFKILTEAGIPLEGVEYGDKWTKFNGTEPVEKNSHYWMQFK